MWPRWCILGLIQSRLEGMERLCLPLSHPKMHIILQSTSSLTGAPRIKIPSLFYWPASSWMVVIVSKASGGLHWCIWSPLLFKQTQSELWCINCRHVQHGLLWLNTSLGQTIHFEVAYHCSPLEGPACRWYSKTPQRCLIHCQEVGTFSVAPVGRQSWDQTKCCIKSLQIQHSYHQQPNK